MHGKKALIFTLSAIGFFLAGAAFALNGPQIPFLGSQGISVQPQTKATSSPETAIAPLVPERPLDFRYSKATFGFVNATGTASSTFAGGIKITGGRLQINDLASCDTIDTDASGVFTCGSDATGGGGGSGTDNFEIFNNVGLRSTSTGQYFFVRGDHTATSSTAEFEVAGGAHIHDLLTVGYISATGTATSSFTGGISANDLKINLPSCDTLDTDASGAFVCGSDDTGTDSADDLSDDSINALSDVDTSGVADSNILMFHGSNWIPIATTTFAFQTDLHDALTLAGTPDYLTLSGQEITLTKLDITDDTNLVAGTNITLSTNTLNVDDAFLINDGDDTTSGVLTINGTGTSTILNNFAVGNRADVYDHLRIGDTATTSIYGSATSTFPSGISITGGGLSIGLPSCSEALETDASGAIVCGTDATAAAGSNDWGAFQTFSTGKNLTASSSYDILVQGELNVTGVGTSTIQGNLGVMNILAVGSASSTIRGSDATSTLGGLTVNHLAATKALTVSGGGTSTFTGGIFANAFRFNEASCLALETDALNP